MFLVLRRRDQVAGDAGSQSLGSFVKLCVRASARVIHARNRVRILCSRKRRQSTQPKKVDQPKFSARSNP